MLIQWNNLSLDTGPVPPGSCTAGTTFMIDISNQELVTKNVMKSLLRSLGQSHKCRFGTYTAQTACKQPQVNRACSPNSARPTSISLRTSSTCFAATRRYLWQLCRLSNGLSSTWTTFVGPKSSRWKRCYAHLPQAMLGQV